MGHILVIEDEPHIRFILRKIFETDGHTVTEADDGLVGLTLIEVRLQPFSLIVLDMRLPKLDGGEFLYRLRQQQRVLTPVLVLTAHRNACQKAEEYGANTCLTKPFNRKHLLDTANRFINNSEKKVFPFQWQSLKAKAENV
jgi:DNA-binding response OmpR family regulator